MEGKPRLLDQMRDRIRVRHYSPHIEQVYCHWVKQFTRFHRYRHSAEMGVAEVEALPNDLAVRRKVSASMWQVERLQLADSNAPHATSGGFLPPYTAESSRVAKRVRPA